MTFFEFLAPSLVGWFLVLALFVAISFRGAANR